MTDPRPCLSMIAAVARNRVIGSENDLPWTLPDDFRYFKRMTLGKPCIMARKTFESLGGALKGRLNIVLTTQHGYAAEGAVVVGTIDAAIARAEQEIKRQASDEEAATGGTEVMILGGASLYEQMLPMADRLYITEIDGEFEGDTRFPLFDREKFREVSREHHATDERHAWAFDFVVYDRVARSE